MSKTYIAQECEINGKIKVTCRAHAMTPAYSVSQGALRTDSPFNRYINNLLKTNTRDEVIDMIDYRVLGTTTSQSQAKRFIKHRIQSYVAIGQEVFNVKL
jgi:hypothetical protein